MSHIDLLLSRLAKVKQHGKNWMACCPAHEDKTPSLGITLAGDGKILLKCFAGCAAADVLSAINLQLSDLFPDGGLKHFRGFQKLEEDYQQDKQKKLQETTEKDRLYLMLCDEARGKGEKLTPKELQKEREIYLRLRHANT